MNNIAFAKLGLNMSPAAMNTTMQIAQSGMLKLAQLKGQFGLNKATLVNKMAQETVDNQLRINKIIDDNALDVFEFKTKTKDKIAAIQSDISLSRKEKADAISKIQTDYHNNMLNLSDKLVKDTRANNDYIDKQLTQVHDMLKQSQEEGKTKVNESILSGGWSNLSPQQKAELAKDAGLSLREVEGMKTNTTYTAVNAGLAAYIPGTIISPASQKVIYDDANARIATGTPVSLAIQQAILANANQLPEYATYKAQATKKAALEIQEKEADIAYKNAQAYASRTNANVNVGELGIKQAEAVPRLDILKAQAKAEKSDYTYSAPREDGTVIAYNKNDPTKVKIIEPVLEKTPAQWKATTGIDLVKAPE